MPIKYRLIKKINPMDREAAKKVYAVAIHENVFKLKELAKELAARSTTASEGDTFAVLIGLRDLIKEHLERSDKVVIDGIGSFAMNVSSEGANSEEEFHQGLIKKAGVSYQQDSEMKDFSKTMRYEKLPAKK